MELLTDLLDVVVRDEEVAVCGAKVDAQTVSTMLPVGVGESVPVVDMDPDPKSCSAVLGCGSLAGLSGCRREESGNRRGLVTGDEFRGGLLPFLDGRCRQIRDGRSDEFDDGVGCVIGAGPQRGQTLFRDRLPVIRGYNGAGLIARLVRGDLDRANFDTVEDARRVARRET